MCIGELLAGMRKFYNRIKQTMTINIEQLIHIIDIELLPHLCNYYHNHPLKLLPIGEFQLRDLDPHMPHSQDPDLLCLDSKKTAKAISYSSCSARSINHRVLFALTLVTEVKT